MLGRTKARRGGLVILVDHDPWFYSPGCKRNPGPNHLTDISQRSFHVHRVTEGSLFRDDEEAEDQGKSVLSVQGLRILQMLERKKENHSARTEIPGMPLEPLHIHV